MRDRYHWNQNKRRKTLCFSNLWLFWFSSTRAGDGNHDEGNSLPTYGRKRFYRISWNSRSSASLQSRHPVYQWASPQHPEKIWNHPKYEQCRWSMPWQCPLWKHVGASKDRIIVWPIQQWKTDCIRTEISNLEILYQLLEQSEDLHHQRWSSSYDQATEILWFSGYSSIVHDVLEKNMSTNLDNIITIWPFIRILSSNSGIATISLLFSSTTFCPRQKPDSLLHADTMWAAFPSPLLLERMVLPSIRMIFFSSSPSFWFNQSCHFP